jgi:hypothetical protein
MQRGAERGPGQGLGAQEAGRPRRRRRGPPKPPPHRSWVMATTVPLKEPRKDSSHATLSASRCCDGRGSVDGMGQEVTGSDGGGPGFRAGGCCTMLGAPRSVSLAAAPPRRRGHVAPQPRPRKTPSRLWARPGGGSPGPTAAAARAQRGGARRPTGWRRARPPAGTCGSGRSRCGRRGVVWCGRAGRAAGGAGGRHEPATAGKPRLTKLPPTPKARRHGPALRRPPPERVHRLLQLAVHLPTIARVQRVLFGGRERRGGFAAGAADRGDPQPPALTQGPVAGRPFHLAEAAVTPSLCPPPPTCSRSIFCLVRPSKSASWPRPPPLRPSPGPLAEPPPHLQPLHLLGEAVKVGVGLGHGLRHRLVLLDHGPRCFRGF